MTKPMNVFFSRELESRLKSNEILRIAKITAKQSHQKALQAKALYDAQQRRHS